MHPTCQRRDGSWDESELTQISPLPTTITFGYTCSPVRGQALFRFKSSHQKMSIFNGGSLVCPGAIQAD